MESNRLCFISIVVPGMHSRCVAGEKPSDEILTVGNHILTLMTVNVHPILLAGITPPEPFQPLSSASFRNFFLLNPSCVQTFLYFWTGNYFDHVQCLNEVVVCSCCQLQLDLHGNILILK